MIAEALKQLGEQAVEASKSETVFERRTEQVVRYPDGKIEKFVKDFPDRNHTPGTLVDLIALANRFKDEGQSPVVWYGPKGVLLIINDADYRNDKANVSLEESGLFRAIKALDPRNWYDAKAFVRLLRVDLCGALDPEGLLKGVKKVKFASTTTSNTEESKSRQSLGRAVSAEISAASELPDYVTFSTKVFTTPGVDAVVGIKAAVEVNMIDEKFQLVVLPDEISNAYSSAMTSVAEKLQSSLQDGIPFYRSGI